MQSNEKNLLPFSWGAYEKRTDKDTCVVTRDGRTVKLAGCNPEADKPYRVIGWIGETMHGWYLDGHMCGAPRRSYADLFLKPATVTVYRNDYGLQAGAGVSPTSFPDKGEAIGIGKRHGAAALVAYTYQDNNLIDVAIVHHYNQPDNAAQ
jgi:hypothetical protein